MKISANIGELSELYVLCRLLADGKIYAADEQLNRVENCFLPILAVFRDETKNHKIKYEIKENCRVVLYLNGACVRTFSRAELTTLAEKFSTELSAGGRVVAGQVMQKLECRKVKAPSADKTDITLEVHDPFTNCDRICGYSIKSDLGGSPTLFNASQATNFKFKVSGLTAEQKAEINLIETHSKIRDRIKKIKKYGGELEFVGAVNETFSKNLLFIDTQLERFLAEMLKMYYGEGISSCAEAATLLEERDPFHFETENLYRHKLKKFLCAVALGLNPTAAWNGQDEANGGYIIVLKSGEVVAYHLHDRNSFENYLLNNTKLDTPSKSKHLFGDIYDEGGAAFLRLNFQIRFKKP